MKMARSWVEWIVGNLDDKRDYRRFMRRVNALPKGYRFAYKKIQYYLYSYGGAGVDMNLFTDLVELFEASAAQGKPILDVIGGDVSGFCDELVRANAPNMPTPREQFNREILEHLHKEEA